MAGTLNKVMLIGHLGDEVKVHYFEGGNAIGRFPVATNETLYQQTDRSEKVVNYRMAQYCGSQHRLAEICEKYLDQRRQGLL